MLVLTRKKNETVRIGQDIEITLIQIDGDRVKIGIQAPNTLTILRGELIKETEALNRASSTVAPDTLQQLLSRLKG